MSKDFEGKVALVTGGSSGIGRAAALAFAAEGARVVVADIDVERGPETVRLIEEQKGNATFAPCDVSRSKDCEAMVSLAITSYGRLDLAFNDAGIEGRRTLLGDYPEDAFRRVIDVNLTGVFLSMKYEIAAMLRNGGGSIVNCASILGQVAFATSGAYVAAKHGVIGLTRNAAVEYATQGIRVNAVCPGFIDTPMLERAGISNDPNARGTVETMHPLHRFGTSEEVAAAVLFLCSPSASFITGHPLLVDGGYVAQ